MADYEIECKECGWQGTESALDSHADKSGDEEDFSFCPDCGSTDFEKIADQD